MAFAARFLSRSARQVNNGQSILRSECVTQVRSFAKPPGDVPQRLKGEGEVLIKESVTLLRSFAKSAGDAPPQPLKGDEILKGIFFDMKKKFDTAMEILRNETVTVDPNNPAAVAGFARILKTVREKAGILSESERIKHTIETRTKDIPDARSYLLALKDIRVKSGLGDELGADAMMTDALDKVEKELKKPLMRNDKKGMTLLHAEFDKINKKLGIRKEDLPKYEEELELKLAKAHLEEINKEAIEAMETQKKREEFKDEEMPDIKALDVRNSF